MRLSTIGNLIAHAGLEDVLPPILELGGELTRDAKKDMPLAAPMVGQVAR